MTEQNESLSQHWRLGKSNTRVIELANAMSSLRKVIGNLNPEKVHVTFNSQAVSFNAREAKLIVIDPTYALKSTPIADEDFDTLVGLSVHEAMHTVCNTNAINLDNEGVGSNIISPETVGVIGEEIYVDGYADRHKAVAGKYVAKARASYRQEAVDASTWENPLLAWMNISLYGHPMPHSADGTPMITPKALKLISEIMPVSATLRDQDMTPRERTTLYRKLSKRLNELRGEATQDAIDIRDKLRKGGTDAKEEEWANKMSESTPPMQKPKDTDDRDDDQQPTDNKDSADDQNADSNGDDFDSDEDTDNDSDLGGNIPGLANPGAQPDDKPDLEPGDGQLPMHRGGKMSEDLLAAIEESIEKMEEDITGDLQQLVDNSDALDNNDPKKIDMGKGTQEIVPTIMTRATNDDKIDDVDNDLLQDMQWIQRLQNHRGKVTNRHLERGKVDIRNLHRAPINGRVFKNTKKLPRKKIDMVMLLDASTSMRRRTAIYDAAHAIQRVQPATPVYSYVSSFSGGTSVKLTNHNYGNTMHKVIVGSGGTPIGSALLATLSRHPESMIFVFTDGENNVGITPSNVFKMLPKQFPLANVLYVVYNDKHDNSGGYEYYNESAPRESRIISDQVEVVVTTNLQAVPNLMRDAIAPLVQ